MGPAVSRRSLAPHLAGMRDVCNRRVYVCTMIEAPTCRPSLDANFSHEHGSHACPWAWILIDLWDCGMHTLVRTTHTIAHQSGNLLVSIADLLAPCTLGRSAASKNRRGGVDQSMPPCAHVSYPLLSVGRARSCITRVLGIKLWSRSSRTITMRAMVEGRDD